MRRPIDRSHLPKSWPAEGEGGWRRRAMADRTERELQLLREALAARGVVAPRCGASWLHRSKCACTDPSCRPVHHSVVTLAFTDDAAVTHAALERAILQTPFLSAEERDWAPAEALAALRESLGAMTCDPGCLCTCHLCDRRCAQAAHCLPVTARPADALNTGVCWGLIGLMPTTVFHDGSRPTWFRFADVLKGAQYNRPSAIPSLCAPIELSRLRRATDVTTSLPDDSGEREFYHISYVALYARGGAVNHSLVLGFHEAKPTWVAALAQDITEPDRHAYLFSVQAQGSRTESGGWRPSHLTALANDGGYWCFLAYCVHRTTDPSLPPFSESVDATHVQGRLGQARAQMIQGAQAYLAAAAKMFPTDRACQKLRAAQASAEKSQRGESVAKNVSLCALRTMELRARIFNGFIDPAASPSALISSLCTANGCMLDEVRQAAAREVVAPLVARRSRRGGEGIDAHMQKALEALHASGMSHLLPS